MWVAEGHINKCAGKYKKKMTLPEHKTQLSNKVANNKDTLSVNNLIREIEKLLKEKEELQNSISVSDNSEKIDDIKQEKIEIENKFYDLLDDFQKMKKYYEDYINNVLKNQQDELNKIKLNTEEKNKLFEELENKKKCLEEEMKKSKKNKPKLSERLEKLSRPKSKREKK